jgi:SAM-dependent methyltransferase
MNREHLVYCASPEWARLVEDELLPWVIGDRRLDGDLLEVGPGPGLTTEILRRHAGRVVAAELDGELAADLGRRLAGTNVAVVIVDATDLPFADHRFAAAACLTMLHHIPSVDLQDAALTEIGRVLTGNGLLVGCDGLDTPERRELHHDDIFVPLDPLTFDQRLRAAGFVDVTVERRGDRLRFAATV